MKKFVMGLLVGAVVSLAGSVYADDIVQSIVGKQIQGSFPVKVNGKQLENPAAVVDGTSYLPVRAIGDALNMEIKFNAELGIELTSKAVGNKVSNTVPSEESVNNDEKIKLIDIQIHTKKMLMANIQYAMEEDKKSNSGQFVEKYKQDIQRYETELAELEKQKAALQQQP